MIGPKPSTPSLLKYRLCTVIKFCTLSVSVHSDQCCRLYPIITLRGRERLTDSATVQKYLHEQKHEQKLARQSTTMTLYGLHKNSDSLLQSNPYGLSEHLMPTQRPRPLSAEERVLCCMRLGDESELSLL